MTARNSVLCVDALVLLASLPDASVDLVLSDPPYGTTQADFDCVIDLPVLWVELKRVAKPGAAFVFTASQPFTTDLISSNRKQFRYEWIWVKSQATGFFDANRKPMKRHESVIVFCERRAPYYPQMEKGEPYIHCSPKRTPHIYERETPRTDTINTTGERYPTSVLEYQVETGAHPTQKPVPLFEYLIRTYTQPGALVLDPYCGSGTTALAAQRAGRDFICGDTNADYVEVALKRLRDADPFLAREIAPGLVQASLFEVLP